MCCQLIMDLCSRRRSPKSFTTKAQNGRFVARLEELTSKQVVTPAEEKLIELLTVLIENFETQRYPVQGSGPLDVIRHLMEENHLRRKDLVVRTEARPTWSRWLAAPWRSAPWLLLLPTVTHLEHLCPPRGTSAHGQHRADDQCAASDDSH